MSGVSKRSKESKIMGLSQTPVKIYVFLLMICALAAFSLLKSVPAKERSSESEIARWTRAIGQTPKDPELYLERAHLYKKSGQFDNALADYTKAIEIGPAQAGYYYERGMTYLNQNKILEALPDLEKEADLEPDKSLYRLTYGRNLLELARTLDNPLERQVLLSMADFHATDAVALAPDSRDCLHLLAEVSVEDLNLSRAIRVYEYLVITENDQRNGEALSNLFVCYLAMPFIERGLYIFERKLKEMPDWQELRFLLAVLYREAGNRDYAVLLLRRIISSPSTLPHLREIAGQWLKELRS